MKIIKHFSLGVDSFASYDKKIQPNRIARPILLLTTLGKKGLSRGKLGPAVGFCVKICLLLNP